MAEKEQEATTRSPGGIHGHAGAVHQRGKGDHPGWREEDLLRPFPCCILLRESARQGPGERHRMLGKDGSSPLAKTKHDWLRTKANGGYTDKRAFLRLTRPNLKTSRAWRIKEAANGLWSYSYRGVAERNWKALLGRMARKILALSDGKGRENGPKPLVGYPERHHA